MAKIMFLAIPTAPVCCCHKSLLPFVLTNFNPRVISLVMPKHSYYREGRKRSYSRSRRSRCWYINQAIWQDIEAAFECLCLTIPERHCRQVDNDGNSCGHALVACAGSSPMFGLLHQLGLLHGLWRPPPKDVDVFVTGRLARSSTFCAWVKAEMVRITEAGYQIESVTKTFHSYATNDGTMIRIINVKVRGIKIELSFVQAPDSSDIDEVVEKFDLSVAKVAFHTGTRSYRYSAETLADLKNGRTRVKDFSFDGAYPSCRERKQLQSTLTRTEKYSNRGFPPMSLPLLLQNGVANVAGLNSAPLIIPDDESHEDIAEEGVEEDVHEEVEQEAGPCRESRK